MNSTYEQVIDYISGMLRAELLVAESVNDRLVEMSSVFGTVTLSVLTADGYAGILSTIDNQPPRIQTYLINLLARISINVNMNFSTGEMENDYEIVRSAFKTSIVELKEMDLFDHEVLDRIDLDLLSSDSVMILYFCNVAFARVVAELADEVTK